MSNEISTLLTQTLRARADEAAAGVDPAPILQLARRRRARRRVTWAAAATAGLLAATAVALAGLPGSRHAAPEPARTSTTVGPSPSVSAVVAPELAFVQGLPVGASVGLVPRAERRGRSLVVVTDHHVTTLPARTSMAFGFTSPPLGVMFMTHGDAFTGGGPDPDMTLDLIDVNGHLSRLHHGALDGFALDPARQRLALAEPGGMGAYDPVHVTVSRASGGSTTRDFREPVGTRLVGWTTQGLLLSNGAWWRLLDPSSGKDTDLPGVVDAVIDPVDPSRLLVETRGAGNQWCVRPMPVETRTAGAALFCGPGTPPGSALYELTIGPDGRFALVGATSVDLRAPGGRTGSLPSMLADPQKWWEDSTHVLSDLWDEGPAPGTLLSHWVRCDVTTGACERAPLPSGADLVNP